jgi:PAS domain-containing protein
MTVATSPLAVTASLVAILASAGFVATMARHRGDPTTRPLTGVAVALLAGAVVHLLVVDLAPVRALLGIQFHPTDTAGGFWLLVAFDLPAVVSGFWFLFALQYTGRDRETSPIAHAAVGVVLVALVLPNVALAVVGPQLGVPPSTLNALLGATIVLAEALALVGVFLVVATTVQQTAFPVGQPAMLTLSIGAVLLVPFAATTLQNPTTTPASIAVSAVLFTATVSRYPVFELLPVASVLGRDRVIDEMDDGVLVVGEDDRVRDLNPSAEALLDVSRSAAVDEPLAAVASGVPDPGAVSETDAVDVRLDSGKTLSVTADDVTDDRGRTLGHVVLCEDVTRERRREHRLGVLTKSLAGATQTEMRTVSSLAADVADGESSAAAAGDRIHDIATQVATMVGHVRAVERSLAGDEVAESGPVDVEAAVASYSAECSDVSCPADLPSVESGSTDRLEAILGLLVAATPRDEPPALRVRERESAVTVTVSPYRPDSPGAVASRALEIARLGAEQIDWCAEVPDDRGGHSVVLTLPVATDLGAKNSGGGTT